MIESVPLCLPSGKGDPELAVHHYVKDGHTCVDVGANVGRVSYAMLKAVGPQGTVHGVEPNPDCVKLLRVLERDQPRFLLHDCAVGEAECKVSLWSPAVTSRGSLEPKAIMDNEIRRHVVEQRRLDDVIPEGPVDFIKIDAQGSECHILDGAPRLLATCPTWFLECWNVGLLARNRSPYELCDQLRAAGLRTCWSDGHEFTQDDFAVWLERARTDKMVNILALR